MSAKKRTIMKEFSILEISGVDEPAQGPAIMSLMKSKTQAPAAGEPGNEGQHKEDNMSKTAEELQAELTKSQADLATEKAKSEELDVIAKMTDEEKAAMAKMDEDEVKKFISLSVDNRGTFMAKAKADAADANPVIFKSKSSGEEFRKSDDPRLVDMAKRDDARETEMAKMRSDSADAHFEKKAKIDFAKFQGETSTKTALAKAVAGIKDEASRASVSEMLEGVHKSVGVMFSEVGHQIEGNDDLGTDLKKSAGDKLDTLAKARAVKDGTTVEKAFSAILETEEGSQLYAAAQ
jgi:hypothetical protein